MATIGPGSKLGPSRCYVPAIGGARLRAGMGLVLLLKDENGLLGRPSALWKLGLEVWTQAYGIGNLIAP